MNKDLTADGLPEGYYDAARDMRQSSVQGGVVGSMEGIGGEVVKFPTSPGQFYICIGSASINDHVVEFWASQDPAQAPLLRIDGLIMAQSPLIPYTHDHPLQMAVVEHCGDDGIIYPADGESPPLYWDIGKIISDFNAGLQTFFGSFSLDLVLVGPTAHPHFPVFVGDGIFDVGAGSGLPFGKYAYSLRYVDATGNRTNWGPETNYIPVPIYYKPNTLPSSPMPGGQTCGAPANPALGSRYSVKFEFRIDNTQGYSEVEIRRRFVNMGAPLAATSQQAVIARIPIQPNQFDIIQFEDPVQANIFEEIPPDEAQVETIEIDKPKAVEYTGKTIIYGNFETASRVADFQFTDFAGVGPITAFTKKIQKTIGTNSIPDGYFNPRVSADLMKYQSGEKYGFGILPWDSFLGRAPVIEIAQSFQFPNRRDVKGAAGNYGPESLTYSDDPCYAADVFNNVGETFECITQGETDRGDLDSVINVIASPNAKRNFAQFNAFSSSFDPGWNATFVGPDILINNYYPWRPTEVPDTADSYDVPPVVARQLSAAGGNVPGFSQNTGRVFAPYYHSLGALVSGVTNIPTWTRAISVVRTIPPPSVICQGIGVYDLVSNGVENPANKSTNSLVCSFPDIDMGIVPQNIVDDIIQNPAGYKIRFVSPQGLYDEEFGYSGERFTYDDMSTMMPYVADNMLADGVAQTIGAWCIDKLVSARVMHDSGDVNVGDGAVAHGFQPPFGSLADANQTGYGAWRNDGSVLSPTPGDPNFSFWLQDSAGGNALFDIESFTPRVSEANGVSFRLQTQQGIYFTDTLGTHTAFQDPVVRRFHQPVYIIQIVRDSAVIPEQNITPYINTGTTILVESCIGIYSGNQTSFRLIDERWEDCFNFLPTDFRYIYMREPNSGEKAYVCLTGSGYFAIPGNLATAQADIAGVNGYWIAPDGTHVYGFYSTSGINGPDRFIDLGTLSYFPAIGTRIIVKYDPNAPIRTFGGDSTIAPCVFAPIDRVCTRDTVDNGGSRGFEVGGLPLPYSGFYQNPRYFMPKGGGNPVEEQIVVGVELSVRQMVVLFDCETRQEPPFLVTENSISFPDYGSQTYPVINYIPRSYHPVSGLTAAQQGFWPQYDVDYPGEASIWALGGFRFNPNINYDYPKSQDANYAGLPQSGFTERTIWCTSLAASNKFEPSQQDTPNLRFFPLTNVKDLSEETGEIKLICVGLDGGGNSLYVWTQRGTWKAPIERRELSNVDGSTLGTQFIENFWGQEIRISPEVGSPDELWRLWARSPYGDTFYWPDRNGFWIMSGDNILPLSKNRINSFVLPLLTSVATGPNSASRLTAVYDKKYDEVLFSIKPRPPYDKTVLVFNAVNKEWAAEYSYEFDEYLCHDQELLGMRDLTTFRLDVGDQINGETITGYVQSPMTIEPGLYQWFQRFKVYGDKPSAVEIYDKDHVLMCRMDQVIYGPDWVNDYNGWENWVARCDISYDANERLVQDNLFFMRVYFEGGNRTTFKFMAGQIQEVK